MFRRLQHMVSWNLFNPGKATFASKPGFTQIVRVEVEDADLADGPHGFHIHQKGVSGCKCFI